jgi:Arc/MetJ-type ribon-helix-helix transcriptional regulator
MIAEYKSSVAFRLSVAERQKIEQLIKEGKFRNRSQVLRAALSKFLLESQGGPK